MAVERKYFALCRKTGENTDLRLLQEHRIDFPAIGFVELNLLLSTVSLIRLTLNMNFYRKIKVF